MAEWPELWFSLLCHTRLDSPLETPHAEGIAPWVRNLEASGAFTHSRLGSGLCRACVNPEQRPARAEPDGPGDEHHRPHDERRRSTPNRKLAEPSQG